MRGQMSAPHSLDPLFCALRLALVTLVAVGPQEFGLVYGETVTTTLGPDPVLMMATFLQGH